jgi:hypothetical protein
MHLRSALIVSQSHNAIFTARSIDILFCEGDIRGEIGFSGPAGSQSPNGLIQIAFGTLDALMGQSSYGHTTPQAKRQSEPRNNARFQCCFLQLLSSKSINKIHTHKTIRKKSRTPLPSASLLPRNAGPAGCFD